MKKHLEKLKEHSRNVSTKLKEHSNNLLNSLKAKQLDTLVEPITNYKQIFLFAFIAILLVHLYAIFLKNPFFYPGLENRTILLLIPLFVLVILFYTPWVKIVSKISELKIISKISELHLFKRLNLEEKAHSFEHSLQNISIQTIKEFLQKEKTMLIVDLIFIFVLLLIIIPFLKIEQIITISNFLYEIQFLLIGLLLIFGALSCFNKKKFFEQIEKDHSLENQLEKEREEEFCKKYPALNNLLFLGKALKIIYCEGGKNVILLLGIMLVCSILGFVIIENMIITVDEGYTMNSINAFYKFGETGLMESGATYNRAEIYSLFSAIIFPFFNDPIVGLRFHNLILYIFSIPLIYILSKKVLKSKNIALFSTFFIATNWFFLILSLTARNYVYGIILVAILMYLCLHLYENKKNNNLTYFLITLFLFFNYFEGVLIYSLHFLIFLFLVELIKGNITIKKALIALFFGIISFFVLVVTFKSSILFILDSFKINLTKIYLEAIIFNGSMIYSLPLIGLSFILISILFCWNYKNNKNLKIIALFPLLIVILQVTIFSDGRSYPRYFGDLIIPILILISFWTYSYLKSYKKIIFLILVTVILLTSLINISSVFNQKLGYSFYQPSNWEKLLNDIPKNAVIITDSPNTVKILLPNQIIYGLRDNPLDSELVYWDGIHYNEDTQEKDPKFKSDWQVNYFKLIDLNEYILCDKNKQLFFYYDKTPKIMSIEQLIEINQKNQVYFVLTHNYLGKTNQKDNTQLYLFIKENSILVAGGEKQKKFAFDFRDFDETNINSSLVSVLKLNSQFQKNN